MAEVNELVAPGRLTLHASAAESGAGNGPALDVSLFDELLVTVNVTAISGAGATLTPSVQASDDGGTTWYTIATFTAITATGTAQKTLCAAQGSAFGDTIRLAWTLTGTTPSCTFAAKLVAK